MIRKKGFLFLTIAASAILLNGCGTDSGTTTDPPADTIGGLPAGTAQLTIQGTVPGSLAPTALTRAVSINAATTTLELAVNDVDGVQIGTLVLTDARVGLKEFKLKLAEAELDGVDEDGDGDEDDDDIAVKTDESDSIKFPGPYIVNLITDEVTPALSETAILAGVYEEVELKLDKIDGSETDESGAPLLDETDPMFGQSIYVTGTYTGTTAGGGVTGVPFTMMFDFDETFELTGAGDTSVGFEIVEGSPNPIVIAFRLAAWLNFSDPETNPDNLDFAQLVTATDENGDTVILLDENSDAEFNKKIRKTIKENIKESADYGKDEDGDGELGSDEDDDPDTEDEDDD